MVEPSAGRLLLALRGLGGLRGAAGVCGGVVPHSVGFHAARLVAGRPHLGGQAVRRCASVRPAGRGGGRGRVHPSRAGLAEVPSWRRAGVQLSLPGRALGQHRAGRDEVLREAEIRGGWYRIRGVDGPLGNPSAQREIALLPDSGARGVVMETYPWDKRLGWTVKEFGPLAVPRRGQTVRMDRTACLLYRPLVGWEQKRPLHTDSLGRVLLGDSLIDRYTFRENYYFVGGDKALNSQDSRYWGLLPEAYIVGRAWRVWWSEEPYGEVRWGRVLKRIE